MCSFFYGPTLFIFYKLMWFSRQTPFKRICNLEIPFYNLGLVHTGLSMLTPVQKAVFAKSGSTGVLCFHLQAVPFMSPAQRAIVDCVRCTEVPRSHVQAVCWVAATAITFLSSITLLITRSLNGGKNPVTNQTFPKLCYRQCNLWKNPSQWGMRKKGACPHWTICTSFLP